MANLEIKLISKPSKSKLKIIINYDIHVDGEYWGKAIDFQTSIDPCWRIYQQRPMGLSYIQINQTTWYDSGTGKFKDKQAVIDYVESSPICYKENSNIFIDNSMQPKKIRDNSTTNQNPRHSNNQKPNNNNHKRRNFRK